MGINEIVEQALETGYLTPTMEAEVGRLCETSTELSVDEYIALDKLMGSLLTGEVIAMPRKQFINVMEELVVSEVISRIAEIETTTNRLLDVGDVSAYALNRLPPLYATTEEGASFQRNKAKEELQEIIMEQVEQAISLYLDRPEFHPERQAIVKASHPNKIIENVTQLLQDHASNFDHTKK